MPAASMPLSLPLAEIAAAHLQAFRTLCALAADLTNPAQARLAATTILSIAVPDSTGGAHLPGGADILSARPAESLPLTSTDRSDGSACHEHPHLSSLGARSMQTAPRRVGGADVPSARAGPHVAAIDTLHRSLTRTRGTESAAGRLLARAGTRAVAIGAG